MERTLKRDRDEGGAGAASDRGQTHPTAQAQATPVSVSQSHQLREKGLGREDTELGPFEISGQLAALSFGDEGDESSSPQTSVRQASWPERFSS